MLHQLRTLRRVWRRDGGQEVIRRVLFAVSRVHTFSVMRRDLSVEEPVLSQPSDIEIREVKQEELRQLRETRQGLPEYFFRNESESLDRCWIGLLNGVVAFVCFVSYRGSSDMLRLGPKDAELAYIYSMPEMRGRKITSVAVSIVSHALACDGFERLWAAPNRLNVPIVRSFERAGLRPVLLIRRYGPLTYPRTPVGVDDLKYDA